MCYDSKENVSVAVLCFNQTTLVVHQMVFDCKETANCGICKFYGILTILMVINVRKNANFAQNIYKHFRYSHHEYSNT
jgi:hypothetical protein